MIRRAMNIASDLKPIWQTLAYASLMLAMPCDRLAAAHNLSIRQPVPNELQLEWSVEAVAPLVEGAFGLEYRFEQSSDFVHWSPLDEEITISDLTLPSQGVLTLAHSNENRFYRAVGTLRGISNSLRGHDLAFGNLADLYLPQSELSFTQLLFTDFTRASLPGAQLFAVTGELTSLEGAKLSGADLTASEILQSNFDAAQLTGATARFARFSHSSFRGADLRFVDFTGTDLFNCDLRDADLRGAILLNTDLRFVRFHGASMDHLNRVPAKDFLIWQIVNEGRPGANLVNANLSAANLREAKLRDANLLGANLENSDLREADLRGADLTRVNTGRIDLRGTAIDSQTILPTRLQVIWNIVNTRQAPHPIQIRRLDNAVLSGGHLEGFNLRNINFSQSVMIGINLRNADLRKANLIGAFLRNADLRFANLSEARITNADLSGALFEETIMPDGTVQGP